MDEQVSDSIKSEVVVKDTGAAAILNQGVQTLRNQRHQGTGPPYIKFGRSIRYKVSDLMDYIDRHRIDPEGTE